MVRKRKLETDKMYGQLEEFFNEKMLKLKMQDIHKNQIKYQDKEHSDEDKEPFNQQGVTFGFDGKPVQIKKPIFRALVTEIDERVKVMADPKFVPFDEILEKKKA